MIGEDPWRLHDALAGDRSAWAAIVDEFATNIWHWARSCGLNRHDAEDVCQVVWYKLQDRGHTIREPKRLAGWLAVTTRHEAIAAKRRADRMVGGEFDALIGGVAADAEPRPDDLAIVGETRELLAAAYLQLTQRCRELLALCWSDLSTAEIAEALGRPIGYVGPTRQRCLSALRQRAGIDPDRIDRGGSDG